MKNVLIVDDEPEMVDIIASAFEVTGQFKALRALDGAEAYRKARNQNFDLICTDYRMPRLTGGDLIVALRNNQFNQQTPIFVISGYLQEARIGCEDVEQVHFFEKPVSEKELVDKAMFLIGNKISAKKGKLDAALLATFVKAAVHSLSTVANITNIQPGGAVNLSKWQKVPGDITGIIAMSGASFRGTLAISFPKSTFLQVVQGMTSDAAKSPEINAEAEYVADELTGIVFGQARNDLKRKGFSIEKISHTVIRGPGHSVIHGEETTNIVTPFKSDAGEFTVHLAIEPTSIPAH